jgi:hypothetical protein
MTWDCDFLGKLVAEKQTILKIGADRTGARNKGFHVFDNEGIQ